MTRPTLHISFVALLAAATSCHFVIKIDGDEEFTADGRGGAGAAGAGGTTTTNNGGGGTGPGGQGGTGGSGGIPGCEPGLPCPGGIGGTCDSVGMCVDGEAQWVRLYGALNNQRARAVVQTPAGDVVVAGDFSGVMTIGDLIMTPDQLDMDIFVSRLSATDGSGVQAMDWGDSSEQLLHDMVTDSNNNIVIGGQFQGELSPLSITASGVEGYVLRLNPDLSLDWRAQIIGTGVENAVRSVASTPNHVYAVGDFDGVVLGLDSAPMIRDAFLVAYEAESAQPFPVIAWQEDFDGSSGDFVRATAVAADADGNAIVVGTYTGTPTFITSPPLANAGGNQSIFVAKVTPTGSLGWIRSYGSLASEQVATDVATDGDDVVVVGYYQGDMGVTGIEPNSMSPDIFVLKLDQDGMPIWGAAHSSSGAAHAEAVAIDANHNIILAGEFEADVTCGILHECNGSGLDAFVFKLTRDGERIWTYTAGSQDMDDIFWDVAVDAAGNVLLAGEVSGDLAGGGLNGETNIPNAAGGLDILVARLSP